MRGNLFVFETIDELAEAGAVKIFTYLDESLRLHGSAFVALGGGKTHRKVYESIAAAEFAAGLDWGRVHFFWGDERCVPPTRPESTYRMAYEALLSRLPVPPENIHRVPGERPPAEAAKLYEADLVKTFGLKNHRFPRFTMVLLGLGVDGQVASIAPGSRSFHEGKRMVMAEEIRALRGSCLTMTLPVINNARAVLFFVAGREKAAMVREIVDGQLPSLPGHMVRPVDGDLHWFLDREAAAELRV